MVFRWVFIPWLQRELDAYRDRVNNTAKRRDRNKASTIKFLMSVMASDHVSDTPAWRPEPHLRLPSRLQCFRFQGNSSLDSHHIEHGSHVL